MYWIQTKFNLNNVIEVNDLIDDCRNKNITQIIIGNEGCYQWIELEAAKRKRYPELHIIYSIYKKSRNGNILWLLQGNVIHHAATLEKAYETGNFSVLCKEMVIPILMPDQDTSPNDFKMLYKKTYERVGEAFIGVTLENRSSISELKIKSENKLLPLQRVRFLEASDKEITDIRRSINGETNIAEHYDVYLKPERFLDKKFEKTKKALRNITSEMIIGSPRKMELWDKEKIQHTALPTNWNKFFDKQIDLPDDQWELKKIHLLCIQGGIGFNARYKGSPNYREALHRLKKELRIVVEGGFYDYFLIIEDFCNFAEQKRIRINQRGSVVASLLAYCLNITRIDPLAYDLKFERFLNPYRSNKPDIDIEVPSSKLSTFVGYFKAKYGEENVSKITSFNNFGFKNALADIRKKKGIKEKVENLLPKGLKDIDDYFSTLEGKLKEAEFKQKGYRYLINLAKKMQNAPKSVSIQPAGLIVGEGVAGIPTTHKDGERIIQLTTDNNELEELGFYKIDILPSKVLDTVEEAWKLVGEKGRKKFNYQDPKTFDLLGKGNKNFVFQLKSYGIKEVFDKIQPRTLSEIMDGLALFRPGTKEELQNYLTNKQSKTFVLNDAFGNAIQNSDDLLPVLKETHGIILYQESVMLIAMIWAGYSIEESDVLRDIISKKRMKEMNQEKEKFLLRSKKMNRNETSTEQVFKLIEKFGEYGFNKPHATSYAHMTYETAYLKANHPKEFFVAELNQSIKNYKRIDWIKSELKRLGIPLLDVDYETSGEKFELTSNGIRYGLMAVKNLSNKEMKEILSKRK